MCGWLIALDKLIHVSRKQITLSLQLWTLYGWLSLTDQQKLCVKVKFETQTVEKIIIDYWKLLFMLIFISRRYHL